MKLLVGRRLSGSAAPPGASRATELVNAVQTIILNSWRRVRKHSVSVVATQVAAHEVGEEAPLHTERGVTCLGRGRVGVEDRLESGGERRVREPDPGGEDDE